MKIGEIIKVSIGDWIGVHLQRFEDGSKYIDCNKKDFDLLLSEGWIEEIEDAVNVSRQDFKDLIDEMIKRIFAFDWEADTRFNDGYKLALTELKKRLEK